MRFRIIGPSSRWAASEQATARLSQRAFRPFSSAASRSGKSPTACAANRRLTVRLGSPRLRRHIGVLFIVGSTAPAPFDQRLQGLLVVGRPGLPLLVTLPIE